MRRVFIFIAALWLTFTLPARAWSEAEPQASSASAMNASWDKLLKDVIPAQKADPALVVPQEPVQKGPAGDFLNHFFLQSRTEYTRQDVWFSGLPTPAGVVDAPFGDFSRGIPGHEAYQPNSDQILQFMNWGTNGWLSPRVTTNFSARYRQDLTTVHDGSPTQSILNTFGANRRTELLGASVSVHGLASDGAFAGTSLQLGRQYSYGAELAAFDGASFTVNRRKFAFSVFGGRRFTYYSTPKQRAIGGVNVTFNFTRDASIEYDGLAYVKGSHNFIFRNRFTPSILFNTYLRVVGGSAVDYGAQVMYAPRDSRTTVRGTFFQKLSDKDFDYDYTVPVTQEDPYIRLSRLYFGPIPKYTQAGIDVRREIDPRVRLGGALRVQHLNDDATQGPYAASFQDYRINTQVFAPQRIEAFVELHDREIDRRSPVGAINFDDVSIAGETRVQDMRLELRRTFGEGGLTLKAGGFYKRFDFQDRFFFIQNAAYHGFLGGAQVKLDSRTRLNLDYSIDDDFFVFRPSIKRAQVLFVGLTWRY
jgi:hypothetical protein